MNSLLLTDFDKICRGCLSKKGEMRSIFGSFLDIMLRSIANIEVQSGDGLPENMCVQCVLQVSRAFTFKQLCERSDASLRMYLDQEYNQFAIVDSNNTNSKCLVIVQSVHANGDLVMSDDITSDNIIQNVICNANSNIDDTVDILESADIDSNDVKLKFGIEEQKTPILPTLDHETNHIKNNDYETFSNNSDVLTSNEVSLVILKDTSLNSNELRTIQEHELNMEPIEIMDDSKLLKNDVMEITKSFECDVCRKMFADLKILKRHSKIHLTQKPHVCNICHMSFSESSNLTKHKKKHTGELRNVKGKPHLCSFCGKGFKWASSLSKHVKHHTKHKILNCPHCPKYYVEARSLNIHLRSHTGEKPFSCDICQKTFTQMCNLEKHKRVHTGERPFLCGICGKGFSQSGYVAIHLRTHTGEKPYECDICGKAFAGSNTLTIHKRTHTGERPYPCSICRKTFTRHETALIHQRTHTGEKPHVCKICNRRFTSSGHLSGHMRSHTGIKPHACSICAKRFAGSSSLKVHMRAHTGEKPYVCNICGKSFTQNSTLTTHLLTHENLTMPDKSIEYLKNGYTITSDGD